MYDLNRLRPARFESKVRLGKDSDGGYVLLREQVEATRVLLSFGVATDWSFEEDFFRHKQGLVVQLSLCPRLRPRSMRRYAVLNRREKNEA